MVEDQGEKRDKQDEKIEFDSAGEVVGYISLDQARVLAIQHARENTEFYGRRGDSGYPVRRRRSLHRRYRRTGRYAGGHTSGDTGAGYKRPVGAGPTRPAGLDRGRRER